MPAIDSDVRFRALHEMNVSKAMTQAFILGYYSRELYEQTPAQIRAEGWDLADRLLRNKTTHHLESRDAMADSMRRRIASLDEVVDPMRIGVSQPEDVADQFAQLAGEWRMSRSPSSFIEDLAMHPAYQRIIGLGRSVVPHILHDLEQSPDHWFWALHCITGEDPVQERDAGNLTKMADAWLQWGRARGLR